MRLQRRLVLSLLVLLAFVVALTLKPEMSTARADSLNGPEAVEAAEANVRLLASGANGMQFTLQVPEFSVNNEGVVSAPGLTQEWSEPGAPALPYYTTLVALPPEANIQLQVNELDVQRHPVSHVQAAPNPELHVPHDDELSSLVSIVEAGAPRTAGEHYNTDNFYPLQTYHVSEPMYYRDLRLVRIDLFPLRYNATRKVLEQTGEMVVTATFNGAEWKDLRPVGGSAQTADGPIAPLVINYEQASEWRSLPRSLDANATKLPAGRDTFKIEVNADGIYEVTYEDLNAAGMAVSSVNPNTFQMMYRGEAVAYEFVGDGDNTFELSEAVRFYGWAFDGSRLEKQFIENNVYWLWADGTPTRVSQTPSEVTAPLIDSFQASVTHEPEKFYTNTRTDRWDSFPNEADAWYWERFEKPPSSPPLLVTRTVTVTAPAPGAGDVTFTVELLSRGIDWTHDVDIWINGNSDYLANRTWDYIENVNITTTIPISALNEGPNQVQIRFNTDSTGQNWYYLNRITVDYERRFEASNNQLIFTDEGGPHSYQVSGFNLGDPGKVQVWDITTQRLPSAITGVTVNGAGPYTYNFGTSSTNRTFIATHSDNMLKPIAVSKYVPPNINPANNKADWLAISHANFLSAANDLAAHRADATFGGFNTHVVDVAHVINQYGYGLPTPVAIQNYLAHALANWSVAPRYVLLVGDATLDPKHNCTSTDTRFCFWGQSTDLNYVLTDLIFNDRFQGQVPSDYGFVLLTGDDLLPEMAIGRIAVQTLAEANKVVRKITTYEELHLALQTWQKNVLFVADDADAAGNFCLANQEVGAHLPGSLVQKHLCLPEDPTPEEVESMRGEISAAINPPTGVSLVNYRGHGGIQDWANNLVNLETLGIWLNNDQPVVVLSMDCLDGHFAFPNYPSLSETIHALDRVGTAAHWSSTGLGYDFEHDPLHYNFYDGLFKQGLVRMGDAIDYSKMLYDEAGYHKSQLYSFTLQGDPAMQLMRQELSITKSTTQLRAEPSDIINYTVQVNNSQLYPAPVTIVDTLSEGLTFVDVTASTPATVTVNSNIITIQLEEPLGWGASQTVQLRAEVNGTVESSVLTNVAEVQSPAPDMDPSNNRSTASVLINLDNVLHLPIVRYH